MATQSLVRADDAVGGREAGSGGVARHGHSGAGADEQVAADGAGVGNLALAHGGGSWCLGPSLAELVDLVHEGAQVRVAALVQPGGHGERNA